MGQGHFADLSFPTLIETDEPISFVSVGVSAVALVTQSKKLYFSGYIGQCKKSQLKENALSLDKNLSLFKHTLIDAHVSAVGLGRTHCVLFIDKIMNSSHNSSFEVLATNVNEDIANSILNLKIKGIIVNRKKSRIYLLNSNY